MSVYEALGKLGSWTIRLDPETTPVDVVRDLDFFEHVVIIPQRVDITGLSDADVLSLARYTGIVRGRDVGDGRIVYGGVGLDGWLGDEDGKGDVYLASKDYDAANFATVIADLLPSAVTTGTIHSVSGTFTGSFLWVDPRTAISYVCDLFDAYWRVNPDGTFDAGEDHDLFRTVNGVDDSNKINAVIVRHGAGGDLDLGSINGSMALQTSADDYTTEVHLLAERSDGQGTIATGLATAGSVPYKDLQGNAVVRRRIVNESGTEAGNATARAQLALNRFANPKASVSLSSDDYHVEGDIAVGDSVYVYDPDTGFTDTANEIVFRGDTINPDIEQVVGMRWPITDAMTVLWRDKDGAYVDLTPHVIPEAPRTVLTVGGLSDALSPSTDGIVGRRDAATTVPDPTDDALAPKPPTHDTPWSTANYLEADGSLASLIVVEWLQPLNTDDSTVTDGAYYVVRYKLSTETDYSYHTVGWSEVKLVLRGLVAGSTYDISVEAYDTSGNGSGYAADTSVVAQPDTVAPNTPAPPTVAGNVLRMQVTHDLTDSVAAALPLDLARLDVHFGTVDTFTPDASNLVGSIEATAAQISAGVDVLGDFLKTDDAQTYVKVIAVDRSGNASNASTAASATAVLVDTQYLADLAVTSAKVNDLQVAKLTGGTINTTDITVSSTLRSSNYDFVNGWALTSTTAHFGVDADFDGSLNGVDGTFTGFVTLDGGTLRTDTTGRRAEITDDVLTWATVDHAGMRFYSGLTEVSQGYLAVGESGGDAYIAAIAPMPSGTLSDDRGRIELHSGTASIRSSVLIEGDTITLGPNTGSSFVGLVDAPDMDLSIGGDVDVHGVLRINPSNDNDRIKYDDATNRYEFMSDQSGEEAALAAGRISTGKFVANDAFDTAPLTDPVFTHDEDAATGVGIGNGRVSLISSSAETFYGQGGAPGIRYASVPTVSGTYYRLYLSSNGAVMRRATSGD